VADESLERHLRCEDAACGTLLPEDAEICDECGSTRLSPLSHSQALLMGFAGDRPVVFELSLATPTVIGRASAGSARPAVDLSRFPGAASVHRQHARVEYADGQWSVSHLGKNPLVVDRANESVVVEPGGTQPLWPGESLQLGRVRLQLVVLSGSVVDGGFRR
jgi:hypothetical protein